MHFSRKSFGVRRFIAAFVVAKLLSYVAQPLSNAAQSLIERKWLRHEESGDESPHSKVGVGRARVFEWSMYRLLERVSAPRLRVGLLCLLLCVTMMLAGCNNDSPTEISGDNSTDSAVVYSDTSTGESTEAASSSTATTLKTGDVVTNSIGMKLAVVPPGEFDMGSPETEEKRSGDESRHRVRLSKPIFMGAFEVTQAEFQKVMETNPSGITDSDKLPVQNVSWEQAVAFCRKLSELPEEKAAGRVYQLPTEAEWEYACRAGSTTATSYGNVITASQANFDGNFPYGTETKGTFVGKPQAVGSYEANAWGLYDMHGNVWEWCRDWFGADYYKESIGNDPQGPENGISHVIRGGSWYNFGYTVRSAYRSEFTPPLEANIYGFRVVASFGSNKFEASSLDNPNPTPMSTPPPAVASTTPKPATPKPETPKSEVPKPDTPMMASADSMMKPDSGSMMVDASTMDSGESMSAAPTTSSEANELSVKPKPTSSNSKRAISGNDLLLFPVALLAFLSLVDPGRLMDRRHYDLLPFFMVVVASVIPNYDVKVVLLSLTAIAVMTRIVWGLRSNSLPKAVVPKAEQHTLFVFAVAALVVVCLFEWIATAAQTSFIERTISIASRSAAAIALVVIGQRWKNRTLGLSLALIFLMLPTGHFPPAGTLLLWAFVMLNRAPLAGTLLGCAMATNIWLCVLVPLWVSFYGGKARRRFLTTSITVGGIGIIALSVLPSLLQTNALSFAVVGTGTMIEYTVTIIVLTVAGTATWYWPKTKSETTVTALIVVLLLCIAVCSRTPASIALASPWLVMALLGGSASRKSVITTQGVVAPSVRRVYEHFAKPKQQSAAS